VYCRPAHVAVKCRGSGTYLPTLPTCLPRVSMSYIDTCSPRDRTVSARAKYSSCVAVAVMSCSGGHRRLVVLARPAPSIQFWEEVGDIATRTRAASLIRG
jgi:hypothetical protein